MAEICTWSQLLSSNPKKQSACFDLDDETWFSDEENQVSVLNPSMQSFDSRNPIKLKLKPTNGEDGLFNAFTIEVEFSDGEPKIMEISNYAWIKKGELEIQFSNSGGLFSQPELEISLGDNTIFPTYCDINNDIDLSDAGNKSFVGVLSNEEDTVLAAQEVILGEKIERTDGSGDNSTPSDDNGFTLEDNEAFKEAKASLNLSVVTEDRGVQTLITFTPSEISEIKYYDTDGIDKSTSNFLNDRFILINGKRTLTSLFSKDEDFLTCTSAQKRELQSETSWSSCSSNVKIENLKGEEGKSYVKELNSVVEVFRTDELVRDQVVQGDTLDTLNADNGPQTPVRSDIVPEMLNSGDGKVLKSPNNINFMSGNEFDFPGDNMKHEDVEKDVHIKDNIEVHCKSLESEDLKSLVDAKVSKYYYVEDLKAYGAMKSLCDVGKQTIEKSNVVMEALLSVEKEINPLKEELYKLKHKVFDLEMPFAGLIRPPVQTTLCRQTKSSCIVTSNTQLTPMPLNHVNPLPQYNVSPNNCPAYYSMCNFSSPGYVCPCATCTATCVAQVSTTSLPSVSVNDGKEHLYKEAIDSTHELKKLVTGMKDIYKRALLTKSDSISMYGFPQDLPDMKPTISVSRKNISSGISWRKALKKPCFSSSSMFSEPEDILGDF